MLEIFVICCVEMKQSSSYVIGSRSVGLKESDIGKKQLEKIIKYFADSSHCSRVKHIYSSPSSVCSTMANAISCSFGAPISLTELLNEKDYGPLTDVKISEIERGEFSNQKVRRIIEREEQFKKKYDDPVLYNLYYDNFINSQSDVETRKKIKSRIKNFFLDVTNKHKKDSIIVITHPIYITNMMCLVTNSLDADFFKINYGSISCLHYEEYFKVITIGNENHLDN